MNAVRREARVALAGAEVGQAGATVPLEIVPVVVLSEREIEGPTIFIAAPLQSLALLRAGVEAALAQALAPLLRAQGLNAQTAAPRWQIVFDDDVASLFPESS